MHKPKINKPKISKQKLSKARNLRRKQTPQEVILWSRLRGRRFLNLKFRRQYPLGGYIVDFVCLDENLIIELDGWQHKEKQKKHDLERTRFLENLGYRVLRFWNNDVNNNFDGVLMDIEEVVLRGRVN